MGKAKYNVRELTEDEQRRLIEIQFYNTVKSIIDPDKNINTMAFVKAARAVQTFDEALIEQVIRKIYSGDATSITPIRTENVVMMYRGGYSIRELKKLLNIHSRTLYKIINEYIAYGEPVYEAKTPEHITVELDKFLKAVYTIGDISIKRSDWLC